MEKYKIISVEDIGLKKLVDEFTTEKTVLQIIEAVEKKGFKFVQIIKVGLYDKILIKT